MALVIKNLPVNAGDIRDAGSIPGLGRSPGRVHGNPLQYSCLKLMDRGAWRATVHGVAKSQMRLRTRASPQNVFVLYILLQILKTGTVIQIGSIILLSLLFLFLLSSSPSLVV